MVTTTATREKQEGTLADVNLDAHLDSAFGSAFTATVSITSWTETKLNGALFDAGSASDAAEPIGSRPSVWSSLGDGESSASCTSAGTRRIGTVGRGSEKNRLVLHSPLGMKRTAATQSGKNSPIKSGCTHSGGIAAGLAGTDYDVVAP